MVIKILALNITVSISLSIFAIMVKIFLQFYPKEERSLIKYYDIIISREIIAKFLLRHAKSIIWSGLVSAPSQGRVLKDIMILRTMIDYLLFLTILCS